MYILFGLNRLSETKQTSDLYNIYTAVFRVKRLNNRARSLLNRLIGKTVV